MSEIRRSAVKLQQGKRTLFLSYFHVREFTDDFYQVDRLDVRDATGSQRLLHEPRARALGRDIIGADDVNEAFLPTSIFLATSGNISYDENTKEMFFDTLPHHKVCPFDVVDGQHRIEGLKIAAQQSERIKDFAIATVIAVNMNETERMLQFVTVNTKQQSVSSGVEQHIMARFSRMLMTENLPYLPLWVENKAEKGDDAKAIEIVLFLNDTPGSPWRNRIHLTSDPLIERRGKSIKQDSFVKYIKRILPAKSHFLYTVASNEDEAHKILLNYWKAVDSVFTPPHNDDERINTVVYKSSGLEFFLNILSQVLVILARDHSQQPYTVDKMKSCLMSAEDALSPSESEVMSPDFWLIGSSASQQNRAGMSKLAASFTAALKQSNQQKQPSM